MNDRFWSLDYLDRQKILKKALDILTNETSEGKSEIYAMADTFNPYLFEGVIPRLAEKLASHQHMWKVVGPNLVRIVEEEMKEGSHE